MKEIPERIVLTSYVSIEECLFEVISFCEGSGGAISASSIGSCIFKNTLFSSCSASHGGAAAVNDSIVFLHSCCFSSCNARERVENGGNAFLTNGCSIYINLMSSYQCAPDRNACGDAVFQVRSTLVHAIHTNFSFCNGDSGECSFGSIETSSSRVDYMNIVSCSESSIYMLPGSILDHSNILDNSIRYRFVNNLNGITEVNNSFIFGNNDLIDGKNVKYYNCFGDINRVGVTNLTNKITRQQTEVFFLKCHYALCTNSLLKRTKKNYLVIAAYIIISEMQFEKIIIT